MALVDAGGAGVARASRSLDRQAYNELFTMHGTIMLLLFGTPMATGLANYIVPLQIGAADVAFPRLNALVVLAVHVRRAHRPRRVPRRGRSRGGRLDRLRAADRRHVFTRCRAGPVDRRAGARRASRASSARSTSITTIFGLRAPGMRMFRMPIFTWNILVTSILILFAFPPLTAAFAMLFIDRHLGGVVLRRRRGAATRSCGSTSSGSSATPRSTS